MTTRYQITVRGRLGPEWSEWFEGLSLVPQPNGDTELCGPVADQAALYGILLKINQLGLTLLAVKQAG
ncbi:MAG: hypothetical protein ACYC4L_10560 [Chloroflexota bacterium]